LDLLEPVKLALNLDHLPHFTTLQKFSAGITPDHLERIIVDLALKAAGDRPLVAIDSTAMQPSSASFYFIQTISLHQGEMGMMRNRSIRHHIKMTVLIDISTQLVVAIRCTPGPDSDFLHFVPTLEKAASLGFLPATILADKGYDSEANRKYARYTLQAETQIPVRKHPSNTSTTKGKLRRRQMKIFDEALYHQRSLVETVHSVIKRTLGGFVRARGTNNQYVELLLRTIAYNSKRSIALNP
jgi:hypothetical protein